MWSKVYTMLPLSAYGPIDTTIYHVINETRSHNSRQRHFYSLSGLRPIHHVSVVLLSPKNSVLKLIDEAKRHIFECFQAL